MDYDKLIERLNTKLQSYVSYTDSEFARAMEDAITAIETLRLESDAQEMQLNEFSEFLCHMTGGLLSKTNYTAQEMISAAEDYQQKVCGECDLRAENAQLRAELEQVKRCIEIVEHQRDEAIYDMTALMAGQCCDLCAVEYCNDRGKTEMCTAFKWRGPKED